MLISQLLLSTISYCYWMIGADSELIELCKEKNEKEAEEKNEKEAEEKNEKDKKLQIDLTKLRFKHDTNATAISALEAFLMPHYPEVTTPPPESLLLRNKP